ncbi:hypothetical protein RDn1_251 [Candidatus Termititenax dinenymphae]|uniref:Schlafen AlbA-2 domain-containing protein n=1 Tax=Candidatus Termititenax dinenymphae TaxID=2218523 RepID=A0A388TKL9_9BACT|nr:hypothetical protein RDn1_251 [Candidatus Termititenax dinenymphae]
MLSWQDFLGLINSRDVKLSGVPRVTTSQDITKKAVELANERGGQLILGFDRYSFQLYGCVFDAKWLDAILAQEITPPINYEIMGFIRSNKRIFVVKIAEGKEKPHKISEGSEVKPAVVVRTLKTAALENISPEFVQKRQNACLEYLKTQHEITNMQYRDLNGVSYKTAHNELSELVARKLLAQVGQGRTTKYVPVQNAEQYAPREISLFGDTLDALVSINNETTSITEIRRSQIVEHMDSHLTKLD